ncbi:MAG: argininosuccinate lyase [Cellvibrionales bacterium TMED148]|nr:argininosuccinate lyase [Porticoccaceae bacterium]RPG90834.1 MAG: argininosuccinate lyase [Cellvibrionales bacterium TMED148]
MTNSDEKDIEGTNEKKLNQTWGGRFHEPLDEFISKFAASIQFDKRLYKEDIAGSIAHAEMLAKVEILTTEECGLIVEGLKSIEEDIEKGSFVWSTELEDVHMNIEAALVKKINAVGKKLHTGRSRNDQVATDIKLWLRKAIDQLSDLIEQLQVAVINLAENHAATIMPGFTHLQTAQPVTLGHHLLAWNEMLERDFGRFTDCRSRLNECPLGAAALAGTTFPIDRHLTASKLSFSKPTENSLDSVSDRDFAMEFCAGASILMSHLSRICEELILWNSSQFHFIQLSDRFATGSSIMPQKKNPDVPELIRGKTGRVTGNFITLLMLMKSQPLAYNKDNQEDKEPLFDTVDALGDCLRAMIDLVPDIEVQKDTMYRAAMEGYSTATDLADYLVRKNIPFREAHEIVGRSVAYGLENELELSHMPLSKLQEFSPKIETDVYDILSVEGSVASRAHLGGTAPRSVKAATRRAQDRLRAR